MKFNKNGALVPQKVKYKIKHEEETEDLINNYININCNFQIVFDKKGDPVFRKKGEK